MRARELRPLLIVLGGQAMASMDGSILAVALPTLRADLHASGAVLQLVVAVYIVAFAVLVVTGARLGDVLGQRRAFIAGLAGFTVASLACGVAPTAGALVAARAVQGCTAALMVPQVLSIIQLQYEGETRARAIGTYSFILAAGVAAGQIVGGLIVAADIFGLGWRPAFLVNVPVGIVLVAAARGGLPGAVAARDRTLDLAGIAVLSGAISALIVPLTFGRDAGWPAWVWPCFAASAIGLGGFAALERRVAARGHEPLLDVTILARPGVAAGVGAVLLVMGAYYGFLFSLTVHLQDGLGFSALHAGLVFVAYASGFATVSLTWTRLGEAARARLPVAGPIAMGAGILAIGALARDGSWLLAATAPLLFLGGAGHAAGFSPLTSRLTGAVRGGEAAALSGLVVTASILGGAAGIAALGGIYLSAAGDGGVRASSHALATTTAVIAGVLVVNAACAARATAAARAAARAACAEGAAAA